MTKWIAVVFICFDTAVTFAQEMVVKGRVVGWDDKPIRLAHVMYESIQGDKNTTLAIECDRNGMFRIQIPKSEARYVNVCGAGYKGITIPMMTHLDDSVNVTVKLKPVEILTDLSNIEVGYRFDSLETMRRTKMQRRASGRYVASVRTQEPEAEFAIFNIARQSWWRIVLGTNASLFRYHRNPNVGYVAVIKVENGKAEFTFDSSLVPFGPESAFAFEERNCRTARFAQLHMNLSDSHFRFVDELQRHQKEELATEQLFSAWMDTVNTLKLSVEQEKDTLIFGELLLGYYRLSSVHGMDFDSLFFRKHISKISCTSPLWYFNNYEAFDMQRVHPQGEAFVQQMLDEHPSKELRAFLLFESAKEAQYTMDEKKVIRNYTRLKEDFGNMWWAKVADQFIVPNVKVKVGAKIPAFSFSDMNDSTKSYTNQSLIGKFYLLDFWATWCLPCIGEIPNLQKTYERFRSKNFELISISSDRTKSEVKKFQSTKKKMPWANVWVPPDKLNYVRDLFEITGIPKPILVDTAGTIVAIKSELRGDNLEKVLERFLGK